MKTILVDDMLLDMQRFELKCADVPDYEIVGKFTNPLEAITYTQENVVDFALLDIDMPGMNGMKLVSTADMDYRNSSIVGLAAALGMGVSQAQAALETFPDWVATIFGKSPVVLATIIAVLPNIILPKSSKK